MRRTLLLATLIALIAVPQSFAAAWIKSISVAQKAAKQKKQFIFVDLFAEWCGWCHRFEQDVWPSEVFQKATSDMVMLRLDTEDGADGTRFAQKYQVTSLPTFLVIKSDMTVVGSIRGYAPPNDFVKMLNDTVTKYRNFQNLVANEGSFATDYDKRLDLAKQFWQRQDFASAEPRLKKLTSESAVPAGVRDQAYYELALVSMLQGKYDDAKKTIASFSRVQSKGDAFERTQLLQSDICMAQGNLRCAADQLRNFKQRFPSSQYNAQVDQLLPNIERQLAPVKQQ
ncbi:MAG TPA: thioredoxin fold domain-containing protein [Thermoanaerobaculia bacterium]|nr:thioredoxin fold domain-containing protein [Thermoanaerobaculia bacterium]